MKKIFVFIGLLVSLTLFSQSVVDKWVISGTFTKDTILKYKSPASLWIGGKVSVDVELKYPHDNTGILSLGGSDDLVSAAIGTTEFKYYEGWDNNPLTIDTTANILFQLGTNKWWGRGYSCVEGFPKMIPAIQWDANTCTHVQYYIIFRLIK